jgi:hypothetical protein
MLFGAALAWAAITGSISGVVTDSSGAVIIDATVTATETQPAIPASCRSPRSSVSDVRHKLKMGGAFRIAAFLTDSRSLFSRME